jgi:hypothetical protein
MMTALTQRRYDLLRRSGYDHWDAVRLVISWEVVNIQLYRKVRGGMR